MIKYFGLAIFGCTCFLVGYFTGQFTTFSNPAFDRLLNQQFSIYQHGNEIFYYRTPADSLRLINKITPENQPKFRRFYIDQTTENLNALNKMLAEEKHEPYKMLIESQIKYLKESLGESGGP